MKAIWEHVRNISIIIIGSFIFSLGITYFAIPNHLGEGGFTGISLLLLYYFQWEPSIVLWVINIPLLIIGFKEFGKRSFIYTLVGLTGVTFFLKVTETWGTKLNDLLLVALYTGVLVGVGLGMIFRVGGTTGGVDMIARLTNKYFGWSFGRTFFLIDIVVITSSIFVIGLNMAMYTMVAVFVGARVVDFVVEGLNASKAVTIISNTPSQLAETVTRKMNRGVTMLEGKGGYTGAKKEVLYVVVAPIELLKLKQVVADEDPKAFIVVHDARDVMGKGFTFE